MKMYKYFILAILFVGIQGLSAQTPEELKSWLPAVEGWSISDNVEIFNPDNLFDRINGAAPLFIENNFREMTSMEYTRGDDYITVQAYRHAAPIDAFGMYSSERSSELEHFSIGGEAQGDSENLYFFAGCIYVKMSGYGENIAPVMQQIATGLANKIDDSGSYPTLLRAFPAEGKAPYSETYITSSYIGHDFLNGVYSCAYKDSNDVPFQLFMLDAKTPEAAKDILGKYFAFTKQPLDFQEGYLTIEDRYNGDIAALWNGRYIIGIFSESGTVPANANELMKKLSDNLQTTN